MLFAEREPARSLFSDIWNAQRESADSDGGDMGDVKTHGGGSDSSGDMPATPYTPQQPAPGPSKDNDKPMTGHETSHVAKQSSVLDLYAD